MASAMPLCGTSKPALPSRGPASSSCRSWPTITSSTPSCCSAYRTSTTACANTARRSRAPRRRFAASRDCGGTSAARKASRHWRTPTSRPGDASRVITVRLHGRAVDYTHFRDAVSTSRKGPGGSQGLYDAQHRQRGARPITGPRPYGAWRYPQGPEGIQHAFDAYEASREIRQACIGAIRTIRGQIRARLVAMKLGETSPGMERPARLRSAPSPAYEQAFRIFDDLWSRVRARPQECLVDDAGMEMPLEHLGQTASSSLRHATQARSRQTGLLGRTRGYRRLAQRSRRAVLKLGSPARGARRVRGYAWLTEPQSQFVETRT